MVNQPSQDSNCQSAGVRSESEDDAMAKNAARANSGWLVRSMDDAKSFVDSRQAWVTSTRESWTKAAEKTSLQASPARKR